MALFAAKNGVILPPYKYENILYSYGYGFNSNYTPKVIQSFNQAGSVLYDNGKNKFLKSNELDLIRSSFTDTRGVPDLTKLVMVMWIEVFEEGGFDSSRRYSSKWVSDGNTWFQSTDGSNKIVLSLSGQTVIGEVYLNTALLPVKQKFSITARLYEVTADASYCIYPAITYIASGLQIKLTMSNSQGRIWIVSDNKGTTPIDIATNQNYLFGNYASGDTVHVTLTDSRRPTCNYSVDIQIP